MSWVPERQCQSDSPEAAAASRGLYVAARSLQRGFSPPFSCHDASTVPQSPSRSWIFPNRIRRQFLEFLPDAAPCSTDSRHVLAHHDHEILYSDFLLLTISVPSVSFTINDLSCQHFDTFLILPQYTRKIHAKFTWIYTRNACNISTSQSS